MNSADLMNWENQRADAVKGLIEHCTKFGLSYSYGDKEFVVSLPYNEPINMRPKAEAKTRKSFNIDDWGPKGPDEADLPDELPPSTTPLEEGKPPEDKDAEV